MENNQKGPPEDIQHLCGHSLFASEWWLEALCPREWDAVTVKKGGRLQARLPYRIRRTPAGPVIGMPTLTQTLGPAFFIESDKQSKRLSRYKDLSTQLINQLPPFDSFRQNFHYSIENWLPWYWAGFRQTTRYTYVLEDLTDQGQIWGGFDHRIRKAIRKAEKVVAVTTTEDFEAFWQLNKQIFSRQGLSQPYSKEVVRRLDRVCAERGQRKIFIAHDKDKRAHAAVYLVWDERSAYYLMGGSDPHYRNSGAQSLLMWEAIQFAATVTERFDFEGSMIEPVERFFRAFGGTPMSYHCVWKTSPRARLYQIAGSAYKRSLGRLRRR
jgi:hypothetical protein